MQMRPSIIMHAQCQHCSISVELKIASADQHSMQDEVQGSHVMLSSCVRGRALCVSYRSSLEAGRCSAQLVPQ